MKSHGAGSLNIRKFYGLDRKNNPIDVTNGYSLDCKNVFQDLHGVVSKRRGNAVMFASDESETTHVDEIGSATLYGVKYYFQFTGGSFEHALTRTGVKTTIAAAYTALNTVWWVAQDDKIFFVDGASNLKFFDPSVSLAAVFDSKVYVRSATAPTSSGGAGFDFAFTVEKGYSPTVTSAESPSSNTIAGASLATITVPGTYAKAVAAGGNETLAIGDRIRIYSRVNTTITSFKNVTPVAGAHANGVYEIDAEDGSGYLRLTSVAANYPIITLAISDDQSNLYTNLGLAVNKTAPTALIGISNHYGRIVGWKDDTVYNSKSSNPHAWPDDAAQKEAFQYTVGFGTEESIQNCVSFMESLYVFKEAHIFVFGGIGPSDTGDNAYSFRRLETNGIGLIAPKSAVVVGEETENIIVFLSAQGFYASTGAVPNRIGEKIEQEIFTYTTTELQTAVAFHHRRDGNYICFVGPANARKGYFLDVRKDEGNVTGWFRFEDLPVKCVYWDNDRYIFGTYRGYSASERVSRVNSDYSDIRIEYILAAAITTGTDEIAVALSYQTGDTVTIRTSGTIPAGLVANTAYFAIRVSATVIKLATSLVNALAGTAIDITTQGVGTHSIVGSQAINSYYSTNWINYGSTSIVKKLGKPGISFDSTASVINLTINVFYDWVETSSDVILVTISSSQSWGALTWGTLPWRGETIAVPKSLAIPRRKVRSILYKFENNLINQDFNLQSLEMPYEYIRNRDNFA